MTQILLLAVIVLVLFMGPRLMRQWQGALRPSDKSETDAKTNERSGPPASQDLVACSVCGIYGPPPGPKCDRSDCPSTNQ